MTGTLMKGMGGLYTVQDAGGNRYVLRPRGRLRKEKRSPLVGDEVLFTQGNGEEHGWLEDILPRKTECLRPPVANLDVLILVIAPTPPPDLLLIDRMMVYARQQGLDILLCVNKADLDAALLPRIQAEYAHAQVQVAQACALSREGMETLSAFMRGRLCCMAGQSGVGKSTLLSQLLGMDLKVGGMSQKIERGRHTTRHTELLEAKGLRVFDTPGFSLLSVPSMPPEELQQFYPEMLARAGDCRFQPCLHDREPDCAVRRAVEQGELSQERVARYQHLLEELKTAWRKRYD